MKTKMETWTSNVFESRSEERGCHCKEDNDMLRGVKSTSIYLLVTGAVAGGQLLGLRESGTGGDEGGCRVVVVVMNVVDHRSGTSQGSRQPVYVFISVT